MGQTILPTSAAQRCEVLTWLPDETLYSLCARDHAFSGRHPSAKTSQRIFGHPYHGSRHDIPANLTAFQRNTLGKFSESEERLCRDRTVLGFYLPWQPPGRESEALHAICSGASGRIKSSLGLLSSRFGADHPLKFCYACGQEELAQYGTPYWHREHQLPGIWCCSTHLCMLQVAHVKANGIGRFMWILPPRAVKCSAAVTVSTAWLTFSRLVAEAEHFLRDRRVDYGQLRRVYGAELIKHGYANANSDIKVHAAARDCLFTMHLLQNLPEFRQILSCEQEFEYLVRAVLREDRESRHPLRHLLFIAWLFGTWSRFVSRLSIDGLSCSVGDVQTDPPLRNSRLHDRAEAVERVRQGGSARRVAADLGYSTETVIRWAARAGMCLSRGPDAVRRELAERLLEGARAVDVARAAGVPVQTVVRFIHAQVGLREKWIAACSERRSREAHGKWESLLEQCPNLGYSELRRREPAVYAWLYRNDRIWLQACQPKCAMNQRGVDRVSWAERDSLLASELRAAIAARVGVQGARTARQALLSQLPNLRRWERKLHKLPVSQDLFREYLRSETTMTRKHK
ncbi:TnsD family Tn7-like transposition protein [Achromobacter sp. NPDC058515]|uniref:TnsD family Tn7-like transposition protein n=1 Tax=Achromobacter sp. NPDC058515 TaxID=3346533 RepID=UPI003646BC4A